MRILILALCLLLTSCITDSVENIHCLDGYLIYSTTVPTSFYGFCEQFYLTSTGTLKGLSCFDGLADGDSGSGISTTLFLKEAYAAKTHCYNALRKSAN